MFGKVLLPLDGSPLAEAALPYAAAFGAAFAGEVTLVHVVDAPFAQVGTPHEAFVDEQRAKAEEAAATYLESAAARVRGQGAAVRTAVLAGPVVETLRDYARGHGTQLIAIATHGRSGAERMLLGSVTSRLIHEAPAPVLTVRPPRGGASAAPVSRVLLPLDGSDLAEQALPAAAAIAKQLGIPLTLVQVVPSELEIYMGSNYVAYPFDIMDQLKAAARAYLDAQVGAAEKGGAACEVQVAVGAAAVQISEAARAVAGTLIVLSSHGRSGLGRAVLGSVADRVIHESHSPVLVIRAV